MSSIATRRLAVALAVAGFLAVAPARADVVHLVSGSTFKQAQGGAVRGQVTAESPAEVTVQLGNSTIVVPTDQIESIEYQGQPASMQVGLTHADAGRGDEAIAQYQKAAAEAVGKPFVIEAAKFGETSILAGLALTEPDRVKDATARLNAFLQAHPNGRHVVAAREALARLQLHVQDFKGAEANIGELTRLPAGGDRGAVLKARLLLKSGDSQAAIDDLDRLIAATTEGSMKQVELKLVKAEALTAASRHDEAEALARQVVADAPVDDFAIQSRAYNTLGDCLAAAARPKDALLAHLHVDLLFARDKEEHPRALRRIEDLFRELGQLRRADEYGQRLGREYPNSPWARRPAG